MRCLVLVTDAFGGRGGIAKFNRDLLEALCCNIDMEEVVVIPRIISEPFSALPPKLKFIPAAARGKLAFLAVILRTIMTGKAFDLIILGHINFLPLLSFLRCFQSKAKLVLVIHGIEAWKRRTFISKSCTRVLNAVISVSPFTLNRFKEWAFLESGSHFILPNCVDLDRFKPGPKNTDLAVRYKLQGKKVIMTLARLDARERYKGIDEVLEALPDVISKVPNLVYLIAGDGSDRKRMEAKVERLGIRSNVIFTGYIPEDSKIDYYRLADAYVMPGKGEGFGITYIEALACGVPVMGSILDGSRDALLNGELGTLVNPENPSEIKKALFDLLQNNSSLSSERLSLFSQASFRKQLNKILKLILKGSPHTTL